MERVIGLVGSQDGLVANSSERTVMFSASKVWLSWESVIVLVYSSKECMAEVSAPYSRTNILAPASFKPVDSVFKLSALAFAVVVCAAIFLRLFRFDMSLAAQLSGTDTTARGIRARHLSLALSPLPSHAPSQSTWILCSLPLRNLLSAAQGILPMFLLFRFSLATLFSFFILIPAFRSGASAQVQPLIDDSARQTGVSRTPDKWPERAGPQQERFGAISGRVIDQTGTSVQGAKVQLKCEQGLTIREAESDKDGRFRFDNIPPGRFQLITEEEGFLAETVSNTLEPGENHYVPTISMHLAAIVTEVRVTPSAEEIAREEFKDLEQQHVFGFIPNFYVSYAPEAAPLTPKRKFELVFKGITNPVTFGAVGIVAGVDQATDRFSGFGQGSRGYAKRYGASYANFATGLWIGGAVLPSILKQDPRYFYKGTGPKRSRFLYAISRPFVCKGDDQHWQPNYSSVLGHLAAGGISNLYIPERDHHGARLTFENAGIGLATAAAIDVLQEFVLRRLTSKRQ